MILWRTKPPLSTAECGIKAHSAFKFEHSGVLQCTEHCSTGTQSAEIKTNTTDYASGLAELKHKIESVKDWDFKKRYANKYELVFTLQNDPRIPPNVSIIKPLSRSYFKMIEMLQLTSFFSKKFTRIRSAHIAEGPGGFIEGFVDECERNKLVPTSITAMTLNPTQIHVPGWKRASNFLHKHPYVSIQYGQDGTGDIYKKENRESFIKSCKNGVNLYTADGGFDFTDNFENQEETIYNLLHASTEIGLRVLLPGGLFILKIFDFYSPKTRALLYTIASCFKEWTIYKPLMSRPCNSERYFIGKDFISWNKCYLKSLDIPNYFINDLDIFQRNFDNMQIESLEKAYSLTEIENISWNSHIENAIKWCKQFHVPFKVQT